MLLFLLCGFHRWSWLISRSLSPYTITPPTILAPVGNMERSLETELGSFLNLTVNEDRTVDVPAGIWDSDTADLNLCMVGRVLSRKQVHLESFERTLIGAWNLMKGARV